MAVSRGIPCITTMEGAVASALGIQAMKEKPMKATALQKFHEELKKTPVYV